MDSMILISAIYIYQLVSSVQLSVSKIFDSHMQMHTGNQKDDVSSAKEFQHHLENITKTMVCLIREK